MGWIISNDWSYCPIDFIIVVVVFIINTNTVYIFIIHVAKDVIIMTQNGIMGVYLLVTLMLVGRTRSLFN